MTLTPEKTLEAAERVRQAHRAAREVARLDGALADGHGHLRVPRDRLAARLDVLRGGESS